LYKHFRRLAKEALSSTFSSKFSDAETEAEETRVWLEFAWRCRYLSKVDAEELDSIYDKILAQLVRMITSPEQWRIR
jgi:four helix bundle protein